VLPVAARPARRSHQGVFDLNRIHYPVYVFRDGLGIERVLIGDVGHHLRLDVIEGSVLEGPVRFHYRLADESALPAKVMTLRRLMALKRLGRFPNALFPCELRVTGWMRAMQAFDGRRVGATQREIAGVLYGKTLTEEDWQRGSSYLRCRVQRALRFASNMVEGGYRRLLQRY
jgi:hypothetical protein